MPETLVRRHERLPARAASVGRARHLVRDATAGLVPEDFVETAELLVSELVSNAVIHAGTAIDVDIEVQAPEQMEVSVGDGSPHRPVRRQYGPGAATGRGIRLLEELSGEWGVDLASSGKRVWFRLDSAAQSTPSVATTPGKTATPSDTVSVTLVDVPMRLYARWQQHAEALLREYLLATLDDPDPEAQLRRHSQCSDAVAVLAEAFTVRAQGVEDEPDNGSGIPRTEMKVPLQSVPHFAVLDETLEIAVSLADTDQLLTPGTDAEMRCLRAWICREVARQAAGHAPTPWRGT